MHAASERTFESSAGRDTLSDIRLAALLQLEQCRQVRRQPGEIDDDGQSDGHDEDEGKNGFGNLLQAYVGDVADDVKVHGHGRRQLANGQVDGHDDAEPDGIPVEGLDKRDQDGKEDVVDGDRIHEHPGDEKHDVDQDEEDRRIFGQGEEIARELVHDADGGTRPGVEAGKADDNHDDREGQAPGR
jgi:hypothetical protein